MNFERYSKSGEVYQDKDTKMIMEMVKSKRYLDAFDYYLYRSEILIPPPEKYEVKKLTELTPEKLLESVAETYNKFVVMLNRIREINNMIKSYEGIKDLNELSSLRTEIISFITEVEVYFRTLYREGATVLKGEEITFKKLKEAREREFTDIHPRQIAELMGRRYLKSLVSQLEAKIRYINMRIKYYKGVLWLINLGKRKPTEEELKNREKMTAYWFLSKPKRGLLKNEKEKLSIKLEEEIKKYLSFIESIRKVKREYLKFLKDKNYLKTLGGYLIKIEDNTAFILDKGRGLLNILDKIR